MASFGVLFTIAYDGRAFHGLAPQANARTVAGELLGAIREIDPRASALRVTSRTDAGVHARHQFAAFDCDQELTPRGWVLAVTPHLPAELCVVRAARVDPGFDPRGHVVSKTYRYSVLESQVSDPFLHGRVWRVTKRLNQIDMQTAADHLVGRHDFAAFRSSRDPRTNTVRRLLRVEVRRVRSDPRLLELIIQGDRFLYRMVRIIVGALVDVGRGRLDANATARALETRDRRELGVTAPPDGLCLEEVVLDVDPSDAWPG